MRVQARSTEQGGLGNPLHTISSKVRATFYTKPPKTGQFASVVLLIYIRRSVQWVLVKLFHILTRQHLRNHKHLLTLL